MKLGAFDITLADDGVFALDGGSMFGVVPRTSWSRLVPPDDRNRIDLALRVILVRGAGRVVLLDAGIGDTLPATLAGHMNVRRGAGTPGALAALGLGPDDVTDLVLTHLHFDHAGGVTRLDSCARGLAYPRAAIHVQRSCWEWAQRPTEKDAASFMTHDLEPLAGCGKRNLNLLDGDAEIAPGIRVIATNGHTPGLQVAVVESAGGTFAYLSDLIPTAHHLKLPCIMAFDVAPLETLAAKKRVLARAFEGAWTVAFGHDPATPACTLVKNARGDIVAGPRAEL